jgi:hypothetical protein
MRSLQPALLRGTCDERDTLMTIQRADLAEIKRGISLLFDSNDVVEVRIPKTRVGVVAGYFNDHALLAQAIHEADARYHASGVYYVLNRIAPALLGRAYNRLKERAEYTCADNNVLRRRWIPVDLDPVRPAGISSTDQEHTAAIERARIIAKDLSDEWSWPIIADSGNGAHLLYRIDLPNNEESLARISGALAELDRRYSDATVRVDVTSANAARIWKAYGTVARKGDSIPGRPHRLSRILEVPQVISDEALARFSSNSTGQRKPESTRIGFDMDGYLSRHAFEVLRRKPWQSHPGGLIFEVATCPFNADHTDGSAAFTLADGVPGFSCKHNGCHSKNMKDVFAAYPDEPSVQPESETVPGDEPPRTQAQILCELAAEADLFHTPGGEAYAQMPVDHHMETWALRSNGFKHWLRWRFYQ